MHNKNTRIRRITLVVIILLLISVKVTFATSDNKIVVSLGDSYSSGEGIEPFYGEDKKFEDIDWLAHRSELSWPGRLWIEDKNRTLESQHAKPICSLDGDNIKIESFEQGNWFFMASSGATTEHIKKNGKGKQKKVFNKKLKKVFDTGEEESAQNYSGTRYLPGQLEVFDLIGDDVADYVTITIGGNDVGFTSIVGGSYLSSAAYQQPTLLQVQLAKMWCDFRYDSWGKRSIQKRIRKAYEDVHDAAGKQAVILVAGYPKLFSENTVSACPIRAKERRIINRNVSAFNKELESIINGLKSDSFKIEFVPVEDAFDGREAYSIEKKPYLNAIQLKTKGTEDLTDLGKSIIPVSSYSIHPNKDGAAAYAKCVQEVIKDLEDERGDDTKANDEEFNKCYEAYKQFLEQDTIEQKYSRNDGSEATKQLKLSECKFILAYIDNDNTPELVISGDDGSQVYSYENNKVILKINTPKPDFNNSSSWAEGYYEKTGYINNIAHIGSAMVNEIKGIGGTDSIVAEYFSDSFSISIEKAEQEGIHIDYYYSRGKDKEFFSGKEEYQKAVSEATDDQELKLLLYANNTPENRNDLIKQDAAKDWNNPTAAYRFNETAWTWSRGSTLGSNSAVLFHPNGTFSQYQYGSDTLIKEAGTYVVEGKALQLVEKEELIGLPKDLKYIPNGREFRSEKEIEMSMDEYGHAILSEGSIDVYELFSKADSNDITYETVSGDWYYAAHMEDFDVPITLNPDGTWTSEYPEEEYYERGEYKLNGNVIELEDYGSSKIEKTEEGFLSFEIDGAVFIKGRDNAVAYASNHAGENLEEDWED